ncbi:MAG: immunity 26/phosphotriesterase HocA family protein [Tannerella sp.]|jgi:hypothetical protein|nr:immunity 26/phosphotriesterase HocA family protein [Tannerella sp.]
MGWFDTSIENVLYSDETLDLAYKFLQEFSNIYQDDLKRKPSVEELEYLLQVSFKANLDEDLLAGFEEKKLESLKFKIGKRKKKLKCKVGDMCAIPLPNGGYAFARILILQPPSWYLSEVFAYYSKDKVYRPEIDKSGYLFYPMFITPNDYNTWHSEIIHQIPEYLSPRFDELRYCYGHSGHYTLVKVGEHYGESINEEEAENYNKIVFYHPNKVLKIIEDALAEKGLIR